MLKNYFKIAFRNLLRHKVFSFINIFGLAIGMACTILIFLWAKDELSYDKFHKNADNIYLVLRGDNSEMTAMSSKFLAPALKEELPEVAGAVSLMQVPANIKILIQTDKDGFEENFSLADSNFFKIFSFKMLEGNPANALTDSKSIVITDKIAKKYFGKENALGKTLAVTLFGVKHFMKVSGVMENIPRNSHVQSQIIFPVNMLQTFGGKENGWKDQSFETYIQLKKTLTNTNEIQELSVKIKECELKNTESQNKNLRYSLMPLTDIHLYGNGIKFLETTGDIKSVRIFIAIAIIILLIAGINYMNLSTALSLKRTREVGIKKTVGAGRKSLLLQFFGESLFLSFIATGFAILLVKIFLPEFNQLSGKEIVIRFYETNFILGLFLLTLIMGLISGSYPAIFLSSFQPIQVLKGNLMIGAGSLITRKGLVIFQFSLSIVIIISTLIVAHQLNFIKNSKLGLEKENLICVNMTGDVNNKYEILKNAFYKIPGVISTSRSESINSSGLSGTGVSYRRKDNQSNEEINSWVLYTDFDLMSTYKFEMQQGRFYSEGFPTDKTSAFVVNEAAAKAMGMKYPLDEDIYLRGRLGKIIGVMKNFHFASFHNTIEPMVIMIPDSSQENGRFRIITIRYKSNESGKIIARLKNIWKEKLPGIPFNYSFYDESLNTLYNSEQRIGTIFKCFSLLSIFIACIGLFGLASLSAEQKTKEIGIRKVLGASTSSIATIFSMEFLKWVVIANFIAWPIAFYFMNKWLEDFAYRIELSWWMFILSGGIALLIAFITVASQAIKAAMANPIDSLKYE